MKVTFLLQDTALFGGVKVVLRQADLMMDRGHEVTVVSPGATPGWYPLRAAFTRVADLTCALPPADVTVATFWATIAAAVRAPCGEIAHYCQGFEASYCHNRPEHPAIVAAYSLPLPALAVSPHLAELLRRRFGRPARVVPQPLEPLFTARPADRSSASPRILVVGPWEIDWKGVETALKAILELRAGGLPCELVRLSQWPQSAEERALLEADEFHCELTPAEVARLLRGCDLILAPSWAQEGFGLPVLEAMASGVPAIASDVPCFQGFAAGAARLVPFDAPSAFAVAARELLGDPEEWSRRRAAGLAVAEEFSEPRAAGAMEQALEWIASGSWRREAERPEGEVDWPQPCP